VWVWVGFNTWAHQYCESIGFDAEGWKGITAAVTIRLIIIIIDNAECEWYAKTGYYKLKEIEIALTAADVRTVDIIALGSLELAINAIIIVTLKIITVTK